MEALTRKYQHTRDNSNGQDLSKAEEHPGSMTNKQLTSAWIYVFKCVQCWNVYVFCSPNSGLFRMSEHDYLEIASARC